MSAPCPLPARPQRSPVTGREHILQPPSHLSGFTRSPGEPRFLWELLVLGKGWGPGLFPLHPAHSHVEQEYLATVLEARYCPPALATGGPLQSGYCPPEVWRLHFWGVPRSHLVGFFSSRGSFLNKKQAGTSEPWARSLLQRQRRALWGWDFLGNGDTAAKERLVSVWGLLP